MDLTQWIKLLMAITAVVSAGKVLYEITVGKKVRLRDEYKFAKEFLEDVEVQSLHPFTREKGYQAIAGTNSVNADEVTYILSLENPARCLKDYVLSKKHLEHLKTKGNLQLEFKGNYRYGFFRNWLKLIHLTLYFLFAFLAISPFLATEYLGIDLTQTLLMSAFSIPFFGMYAWFSLFAFARIYRGGKLVNGQNQHTMRVQIKS